MFAHASGFSWDEALMVMVPIALIAGVLFLANSRAKRLQDPDTAPDADANVSGAAGGAAVPGDADPSEPVRD